MAQAEEWIKAVNLAEHHSLTRQIRLNVGAETLTLFGEDGAFAGRGKPALGHGHRFGRLDAAAKSPASRSLEGGGAPHRPRDQEPAHADPAFGPAPPQEVPEPICRRRRRFSTSAPGSSSTRWKS
ncbi:MAG: hypothetical protein MZU91_11910 [Desulfosudis oleivorans]|nr:hypothetical protein [Desulfosudis oleivorans]